MNETCSTYMYCTNTDKILFEIRGRMYHLRSLRVVAKIIKGILEKCVIMVCRTFQWIKMWPKGTFMHTIMKGKISLNSSATNTETIRNLNREVKWAKKWNKLKSLITYLLIYGSSNFAAWLSLYMYGLRCTNIVQSVSSS
jgi:hypothetical protein